MEGPWGLDPDLQSSQGHLSFGHLLSPTSVINLFCSITSDIYTYAIVFLIQKKLYQKPTTLNPILSPSVNHAAIISLLSFSANPLKQVLFVAYSVSMISPPIYSQTQFSLASVPTAQKIPWQSHQQPPTANSNGHRTHSVFTWWDFSAACDTPCDITFLLEIPSSLRCCERTLSWFPRYLPGHSTSIPFAGTFLPIQTRDCLLYLYSLKGTYVLKYHLCADNF